MKLENSVHLTMTIRKATLLDLKEIRALCVETILTINSAHYTQEEVEDWSSCGQSITRWADRLQEQDYWVCEINNEITGVGSLKEGSHVGSFFVHKNYQRQGVGQKIMNHIIKEAKKRKTEKLDSEVSITAKPFFEQNGFKVIKQQLAKANKLHLVNFVMEKVL